MPVSSVTRDATQGMLAGSAPFERQALAEHIHHRKIKMAVLVFSVDSYMMKPAIGFR